MQNNVKTTDNTLDFYTNIYYRRHFVSEHQKSGDHKMNCIYKYSSPTGSITMASNGTALIGLWFDGQKYFAQTLSESYEEKLLSVFEDTIKWLDIYFSGEIPDFTPELSVQSTPFRKAVWDILLTIPYGQTMTYGEIAEILAQQTGKKKMSAKAVGGAVGHNPISIIIPCHRVVGADGRLTGYAGGIDRKRFLLELEGIVTGRESDV